VIVYDYREDRSRVPEYLRRLEVPIQGMELEVGDYIVGNVAVERKEIGDYLGSLTSGHLNQQLWELSYNFELSYLLVVGIASAGLMERKLRRQTYVSSLVGSSLKRATSGKQGQVVTVNLETDFDAALFLKYLHDKVIKGEPRLPRVQKLRASPNEELVNVLAAIPGIGEVRARDILRHPRLNTLQKVMNADVETLCEVEGVGVVTARSIVDIARRRYAG